MPVRQSPRAAVAGLARAEVSAWRVVAAKRRVRRSGFVIRGLDAGRFI
jgi:hypothetical protein